MGTIYHRLVKAAPEQLMEMHEFASREGGAPVTYGQRDFCPVLVLASLLRLRFKQRNKTRS